MAFSNHVDDYPNLSLPVESMQTEYDVVVVGSGYGAGVAASRMARAGKSVAVLELGYEVRPGSYPSTFIECVRHSKVSGKSTSSSRLFAWLAPSGVHGATRLFQLLLGDGQHVFKAHGLGGGSLINAGVFLKPNEETMSRTAWPPDIRDNLASLKRYYDQAAEMLEPACYPEDRPTPQKFINLKDQFPHDNCYRVPLTTSFSNKRNRTGIRVKANNGSGQEFTGLNDGSKNSVAVTYLADAWNWGAEIFCGVEVLRVEPTEDDHETIIYFVVHQGGRPQFKKEWLSTPMWVKAKEFCFLGAGAVGTTEILMRSKHQGISMSPQVGKRMSGNGDLLLFGYNGRKVINGVSSKRGDRKRAPGPLVTGVVDRRHHGGSGYVVQDGIIPEPCTPFLQAMLIIQTFTTDLFTFNIRRLVSAIKSLIFGAYTEGGAIMKTAMYLAMSHDTSAMSMRLENDQPVISNPAESRSRQRNVMKDELHAVIKASGAKMGYLHVYGRGKEEVTVHPLGGAVMSSDGTGKHGVVNHLGQVFSGHGSEVYPGLVCCDASTIPTSLSINPLATITAVAERNLHLLSEEYGFRIDYETRNGYINRDSQPKKTWPRWSKDSRLRSTGWQFTELLEGSIQFSHGDTSTLSRQKRRKVDLKACLTIDIAYLDDGSMLPSYEASCTGTVMCSALSSNPLMVTYGRFDFFVEDEDTKLLVYQLEMDSTEGGLYNLKGIKTIDSSIFASIAGTWKATTTVDVELSDYEENELGHGQLKISSRNFLQQMTTFRCKHGYNLATLGALALFLLTFAYHILTYLLQPLARLKYPVADSGEREQTRQPSKCQNVTASDGVKTLLEAYNSENIHDGFENDKPPILFLPGVTGVRAEHQVFNLPYLDCNLVDYFTTRGHRCYVLTPRWGSAAVAEHATVYDCRLDVAAAIDYIRREEEDKPYVVAHCQGSVALGMALLTGCIQAEDLLGITANSVFMNQVFGYWNGLKGRTTALIRLYERLAGNFFPMVSTATDAVFQRVLDQLLRLYPVTHRRDICSSTACHRTSFGFGLLWNHRNLNAETHKNVHRFFAGTYTKLLAHVVRMGTRGEPLDNNLRTLLTDDAVDRLEGLPILFISGSDNEVFDPETTLRDYDMLVHRFGERHYRRFVADDYGHLDPLMGQHADVDVWWRIEAHIEEVSKLRKAASKGKSVVSESTSPAESVA